MNKKASKRTQKKTGATETASFADRMRDQREKLFEAMAIVDCCRFGSDSRLGEPAEDRPDLVGALGAAYRLINEVAEAMEILARPTNRAAPS
jgi:hypothetical protein